MEEYAGPYYGQNPEDVGASSRRPINSIYQFIAAMLPLLAGENPSIEVTTDIRELRPYANARELALRQLMREIRYAETYETVLVDAMAHKGIVKVGLTATTSPTVSSDDDPGRPYVDAVDLDNYIIDPRAQERRAAAFEGDKYLLPLSYVEDSGFYEKTSGLKPLDGRIKSDENRTDQLSTEQEYLGDEIEPLVRLVDLWVPSEGKIITIPDDDCGEAKVLREVEYDGPEDGPYDVLSFVPMPHNTEPVSAIGVWFDLYRSLNTLARKASRQAERSKSLLLYALSAADKEVNAVKGAKDGEYVGVTDPNLFTQAEFGGTNERTYDHLGYIRQTLGEQSGNIGLVGGYRAQSDTLGQDEILAQQAGKRIAWFWLKANRFQRRVLRRVAWYEMQNPLMDRTVASASGARFRMTEDTMQGDFDDYRLEIRPYTSTPQTPDQRKEEMLGILERAILPTIQLQQAQGQVFDARAFVDKLMELGQLQETDAMWKAAVQPATMEPVSGQGQPQGSAMDGRQSSTPRPPQGSGAERKEMA